MSERLRYDVYIPKCYRNHHFILIVTLLVDLIRCDFTQACPLHVCVKSVTNRDLAMYTADIMQDPDVGRFFMHFYRLSLLLTDE